MKRAWNAITARSPSATTGPTASARSRSRSPKPVRCLDAGMQDVGELGIFGQDYTLADPDFLRLAEACIRRDVPLNLHVSEEIGHTCPGKSARHLRSAWQVFDFCQRARKAASRSSTVW
jgi:hypothetical protein